MKGTSDLKRIFHTLIEPTATLGSSPRATLQAMGVLARPVFETIRTNIPLRLQDLPESMDVTEEDLERLDRILALRADNTERRLAILTSILPIAAEPENSILYFGPTVRDAECMTFLLRQHGIASAVVSGSTRDVTRRQIVTDFKDKKIRVLTNCEVLATGFDAPAVTHIVMARPTMSRVLYEQIVGRGLRGTTFGGTETCVILDCADNYDGVRPELGYEQSRRVWSEESEVVPPKAPGRGRSRPRSAAPATSSPPTR
jgi:superfamily II DNA or RNA helicase